MNNTITTINYTDYSPTNYIKYDSANDICHTTSNIGIDSIKDIVKSLIDNEKKQLIFNEYKCHNCGAPLDIPNDKHVMTCPYCNSVYAYGLQMVNGRG